MNAKSNGIALVSAGVLLGAMAMTVSAGELYVGAGAGIASYESSKFVDCFGGCGDTFSDSDTGWTVFAGYELSKAVAVELGYSDYGSLKDTVNGDDVKVQPTAVTVAAVGTVPVYDNISVFGKAGIAFLSVDATDCFDGSCDSGSASSEDLMLGGGVDYRIGQFRVRLEGQWIDAEDADKANYIGLSGIYGFDL